MGKADLANVKIEADDRALAQAAAAAAANQLNTVGQASGRVTWVLSGGKTPINAYNVLVSDYQTKVDWSKVWVLVGDERSVPCDNMESNWEQAKLHLLSRVDIPIDQQLKPDYSLNPEAAALRYNQLIAKLPKNPNGAPRLDYVWLGVGEDGHTLSLFPGQLLAASSALVAPVRDAPKPPPERISLTLSALENVGSCLVMASGENKASAVAAAMANEGSLPITQAINRIEAHGGSVTWLLDRAAASKLNQS